MGILGRSKQQHKMKTATSMITRPMSIDTPVDYAERSGAAFLPTFHALVVVPFSEAIVSGFFASLGMGAIVFLLACLAVSYIRWLDGWFIFWSVLVCMLITGFVVSWWEWAHRNYKDLLWYKEFATGPEPERQNKGTYEARVKTNNNWVHADLPFDRERPIALVDFAKAVSSGMCPFSERGAGRYGYGVTYFNDLRDNFLKARMAYWKNPKNKREGVGLNAAGYALLKSVADNPPPADYEPSDEWGMSNQTIQK